MQKNYENLLPIVVYSKKPCVQCDATYRKLNDLKLPYITIRVDEDEVALQKIKDMGYQQAPVVILPFDWVSDDGQHWSGFQPALLESIRPR